MENGIFSKPDGAVACAACLFFREGILLRKGGAGERVFLGRKGKILGPPVRKAVTEG